MDQNLSPTRLKTKRGGKRTPRVRHEGNVRNRAWRDDDIRKRETQKSV